MLDGRVPGAGLRVQHEKPGREAPVYRVVEERGSGRLGLGRAQVGARRFADSVGLPAVGDALSGGAARFADTVGVPAVG